MTASANVLSKHKTNEEIEEYLTHVVNDDERARRRYVLLNGVESSEAQSAIRTLDKMLANMENILAHGDFLAGDHYSLADAALTPFVLQLDLLELQAMWTERRPRVDQWWQRICARPSFEEEIQESATDVTDSYRQMVATEGRRAWPRLKEILEQRDQAGS